MGSKALDKGGMTPEMRSLAERLGRRLGSIRERLSLTQEEVAGRTGLSTSYVSMLERGQRLPHLSTLTDLARVLCVDLLTLLAGDSVKPFALSLPLTAFIQDRGLTTADVDRLISVARLMFPHRPGDDS